MDQHVLWKFFTTIAFLVLSSSKLFYKVLCQGEYEGALRLVNGAIANEGRLEIYHLGEWGTICDDSWDTYDGEVACRQLGYSGVEQAFSSAYFGEGYGRIWLDDLQCSGTEGVLTDCSSNGWGVHNCGHSEDAGLRCSTAADPNSLRLVDGVTANEGRLEIYHLGEWGTICDDSWDTYDGEVACRQLGFTGVEQVFSGAYFGEGYGRIWLDDLQCSGTEEELSDCPSNGWGVHNCGHSEDAGLRCSTASELRLVNGATANEGRVEIYHLGEWGTICDDSWDTYDGEVACRQLGFTGVDQVYTSAYFGEGYGRIWLDNTQCSGSELALQECQSNGWGIHDCTHSEDAGVRCSTEVSEGAVRLVDGPSDTEGRLEVYQDTQWGTVCDDLWDEEDSRVVCRQLGYEGDVGYFSTSSKGYAEATGQIWLDSVQCYGYEERLEYCNHDGWGVHDCSHSEDIGIRCSVSSGSGLSGWEIFGIVAGSLAGVFFFYHCCLKKEKGETSPPESSQRTENTQDAGGERTIEPGNTSAETTGELALTHLGDPNSSLPDLPPPAYEDIGKFMSYQVPGSEALYPPTTNSFLPPTQPYNSTNYIAPYPPAPSTVYPPPPPPSISGGSVAYSYATELPSAHSLPPAS